MTFVHLDQVLTEVAPLGQLFSDAGYRLFLVGGIVRDQWLDEPHDVGNDIDLTTNAHPTEIKRIIDGFAEVLWTQGERFGTIGLRARGRDYEITTHRAESYTTDSRKPQVSFGDDIDVDLSRRDFTVNAMAIELPDGDLVDPFGGAVDLPAGRLRTPLSADVSFTDDPLRMLRAARFATRYSLNPDEELVTSASNLHKRLRIVAIERIGAEMQRLLSLDDAEVGLRFLADTGLLAEVLSYGEPLLLDDIAGRVQRAVEVAIALPPNWHQRLAALGVAVFDTTESVQRMGRRLRLSREDERRISRMTGSALGVVSASDRRPETVRRWIAGCDDQRAAIELAKVLADSAGHVDAFGEAVAALTESEDTVNVFFLNGQAIMSLLGISPGPVVGEAHAFLHERYFESGPIPKGDQREMVRSWWAARSSA
jgi:poly(A) polymerase